MLLSGATVWFRQRLEGPYVLKYTATPVAEGGPNDRVSDLNNFWNATDVRTPDDLFATPRGGALAEYDHLTTYYSGYGANHNTTTRLRRYVGEPGVRPLVYDYTEPLLVLNEPRIVSDGSGPVVEQRAARLRLHGPAAVHRRALPLPDGVEPLPDRRSSCVAARPPTSLNTGAFRSWRRLGEWLMSPRVNPCLRSRRSHSKVNHVLLWQTIRRVTAKQ
ncbi:hypothetical protein GCM10027072_71570 [Streptomyces bullii]